MATQTQCAQPSVIADRLLQVIVCPVCKNSLSLDYERERLLCRECRQSYPVRDGVPVLLAQEAIPQE